MKRILGLDLGTASIGWAVLDADFENNITPSIVATGQRIIPFNEKEDSNFLQGKAESVCKGRTIKRGARRNLDRTQQRRKSLRNLLVASGLGFDESLNRLSPLDLWKLRADAADGIPIGLDRLGRVIDHLSNRRGYRHSKSSDNDNDESGKSKSDYLADIAGRDADARQKGMTPGQYFFNALKASEYTTENGGHAVNFVIKKKVFPRKAYEDELRKILSAQQNNYPRQLTEQVCKRIFDIIFYQRPLKSCKHLVSLCEFESYEIELPDGRKKTIGPRVAPASSPLAQLCRILETVNNLSLKNYKNTVISSGSNHDRLSQFEICPDPDERKKIADFLNTHEKLSSAELLKIMRLKRTDGFAVDKNVAKGIKGNSTYWSIKKALGDIPGADALLEFNIELTEEALRSSGEIIPIVDSAYLRQPLYMLWHTLYTIDDLDELAKALNHKFNITDPEVVERLYNIDFRGAGYANKSSKFIRKLIPQLLNGLKYSDACEAVGVNHSNSLTVEERAALPVADSLQLIKKGELRQPVVEKILNQMIHQVNAIIATYGPVDEIRVEMARQLKQSRELREKEFLRNKMREKDAIEISDIIASEYHTRPTRNKIQKYRMWREAEFCCMYCGKPIGIADFLQGSEVEKEHIIPRSIFFDDSFSNKVCACRDCNHRKGQQTGYDFMLKEGPSKFQAYIDRINRLHDKYFKTKGREGISKTKLDRLMMPASKIPSDFIERDLKLTQYITRKAVEILQEICRNVYVSNGAVTDFLRHSWGYDTVLHNLNLPAYSRAGQTEIVEIQHAGQIHYQERIINWTKRLDHRHHAIDALIVALTRQAYIKRLNDLNKLYNLNENNQNSASEKFRNLDKWAASLPHVPIHVLTQALASSVVSFKSGKKVATKSKRIIFRRGKPVVMQRDLLTPRGSLSEETVYGAILIKENRIPLKDLFSDPESICNPAIRNLVTSRIEEYDGDAKQALKSCKKEPLIVKSSLKPILEADCYRRVAVRRVKLSSITYKNVKKIVDNKVRDAVETRFKEVGNNDKAFAASLAERPIYMDKECKQAIKNVRCMVGDSPESMMIVQKDPAGNPIGYSIFGNNHHCAIYSDEDGNLSESIVTFADAVRRKNLDLPVIITNPDVAWDKLQSIKDQMEERFLRTFPSPHSRFLFSMQTNDMFLLGLSDARIEELLHDNDLPALNAHLFRVQKISHLYYDFKRHSSTVIDCTNEQMENGNYIRIQSFRRLKELNPVKVSVDRLGRIEIMKTF